MAVPEDMKAKLRSVLLSKVGGLLVSELNRDYKKLVGEHIKYRNLGFHSLEEMIKSIPDVARIKQSSDGDKVFGILNNPNIRNHTARKAQYRPTGDEEIPALEKLSDGMIWHKELQPNLRGLYCLCMPKQQGMSRQLVNEVFSEYGEVKETGYTDRYVFVRFGVKDHALAALKGLSVKYDVRIPTEKNDPRRVIKEKDVTGEMPAYPVVKAVNNRLVKSGGKVDKDSKSQMEVFIGNLPLSTTLDEIKALTSEFNVLNARVRGNDQKRFAFVLVPDETECCKIVEKLHKAKFKDRVLISQASYENAEKRTPQENKVILQTFVKGGLAGTMAVAKPEEGEDWDESDNGQGSTSKSNGKGNDLTKQINSRDLPKNQIQSQTTLKPQTEKLRPNHLSSPERPNYKSHKNDETPIYPSYPDDIPELESCDSPPPSLDLDSEMEGAMNTMNDPIDTIPEMEPGSPYRGNYQRGYYNNQSGHLNNEVDYYNNQSGHFNHRGGNMNYRGTSRMPRFYDKDDTSQFYDDGSQFYDNGENYTQYSNYGIHSQSRGYVRPNGYSRGGYSRTTPQYNAMGDFTEDYNSQYEEPHEHIPQRNDYVDSIRLVQSQATHTRQEQDEFITDLASQIELSDSEQHGNKRTKPIVIGNDMDPVYSEDRSFELYCSGFNYGTHPLELLEVFKPYGASHVKMKNNQFGSKTYAFIVFNNYEDASDAFTNLDGQVLNGREIAVNFGRNSVINDRDLTKKMGNLKCTVTVENGDDTRKVQLENSRKQAVAHTQNSNTSPQGALGSQERKGAFQQNQREMPSAISKFSHSQDSGDGPIHVSSQQYTSNMNKKEYSGTKHPVGNRDGAGDNWGHRNGEVSDNKGPRSDVGDNRGQRSAVGDNRGQNSAVGDNRGQRNAVGDNRGQIGAMDQSKERVNAVSDHREIIGVSFGRGAGLMTVQQQPSKPERQRSRQDSWETLSNTSGTSAPDRAVHRTTPSPQPEASGRTPPLPTIPSHQEELPVPASMRQDRLAQIYQDCFPESGYPDIGSLTGNLCVFPRVAERSGYFWGQLINENMAATLELSLELAEQESRKNLGLYQGRAKRAAALFAGEWYRVWVEDVVAAMARVFFLDWGNVETLPVSDLRELSKEFWLCQPAALPFKLQDHDNLEELIDQQVEVQFISHQDPQKVVTVKYLESHVLQ